MLAYREHKGLNERIPDYAVKLGFGMHIGWAIEGLIGSPHKVDASYLSPHVNLSDKLEASTKQYGCNFLLSDAMYDLLSKDFKAKCRCIDRCLFKGIEKPIKVYTFEVDITNLPKTKDRFMKMSVKERQKAANHEKQMLFNKILNEEVTTTELLEKDKEVRRLLHFHKMSSREPFLKNYNKAFNNYLKGNWEKAHEYFVKCLVMNPQDGPSKWLDSYMQNHSYNSQAAGWKGYAG